MPTNQKPKCEPIFKEVPPTRAVRADVDKKAGECLSEREGAFAAFAPACV